jgi:uncharacterized membrane protein
VNSSADIVVGLVVLAWLLWRQTQKRPVREDRKPTVLLILLVLGVVALSTYFKTAPATGLAIALLVGSLVDGGAKGLGSASILLYLAVSLGAQRLVVQSRANHAVGV